MLVVAEHEQLPIAQARTGKPEAWDALFHRYQKPLYVYAHELVHDEQASLDIVQETFIAATRHLGGLRDDAKFGSWLFGIAHQKCIQRWRQRDREAGALEELAATPDEVETWRAAGLLRPTFSNAGRRPPGVRTPQSRNRVARERVLLPVGRGIFSHCEWALLCKA